MNAKSAVTGYLLTISAFVFPSVVAAAELLDETKAAVQEWIRVEQLISQESRQWREEKASIEDLLTILEAERRILRGQIDEAQQTASRADEERAALVEQLSAYQEVSSVLETTTADYERQLSVLQPRLPGILQRELSPRFGQIAAETNSLNRSLSERVQTVMAILSEIEAFESSAVLTSEAIPIGDNREIEAQVIYLGLSRAFYANGSGTISGIGVPNEFGWEWTRDDDLGTSVLDAIQVYESRLSPRLVELPMQVTQ